jgi:hypothetical protein
VYEISCQGICGQKTFPLACKRGLRESVSEKILRRAKMLMRQKWGGRNFDRAAEFVGAGKA